MLQDTTGQSHILNTRPFTTISNNPRDRDVITPNQLYLLKSTNSLSPGLFNSKDIYPKNSCSVSNPFLQEKTKTMLPKSKDVYRTTVSRLFLKIIT